jgi:hypothetical protein
MVGNLSQGESSERHIAAIGCSRITEYSLLVYFGNAGVCSGR